MKYNTFPCKRISHGKIINIVKNAFLVLVKNILKKINK